MDNVTIDLGPETERRARRAGGADRRPGRRADPRRGGRAAPRDDQLRGHLRDLGAGARAPTSRDASSARSRSPARRPCGAAARRSARRDGAWIVGGAIRDALLGRRGDRRRPRGRRRRGGGRARAIARRRGRPRVPALGASSPRWRAAVGRPRLARRRHLAARRGNRGRPRHARLHRQRDRAAARRRRAARPARRRSPTLDGAACCARSRDAARSPTTRCGSCARRGSPRRSASRSSPGPSSWPARRRERAGGAGGRAPVRRAARASSPAPTRCGGCALLDELGATPVVLPELDALRGVEQNPYHHLDVHGHTHRGAGERWLELEADLAAFVGADVAAEVEALLAEPLADELTRRGRLRFAALFHDLGKPRTRDAWPRAGASCSSATTRGRRGSSRELCSRLRTSRRLAAYLRVADAQPPAARLPRPRAAAVAPRRLRVPQATEPESVDVDAAHRRRPARHPGRAHPAGGDRRPPRAGARDDRRGARVAARRASAIRRSAATSSPPSWASSRAPSWAGCSGEIEAARVRRRGRRRATTRSRSRAH